MNPLEQEQLKQARIRFYLTCILITATVTFCFTGVSLMWFGLISQEAATEGIKIVINAVLAGTNVLNRVPSLPIESLP